jgi:hypothetical protein
MGNVSKLALVYAEPMTDAQTASQPEIHTDDGFTMPFSVSVHPAGMKPERLPSLYRKAREIHDLPEAPDGRGGCDDCKKLETSCSPPASCSWRPMPPQCDAHYSHF